MTVIPILDMCGYIVVENNNNRKQEEVGLQYIWKGLLFLNENKSKI